MGLLEPSRSQQEEPGVSDTGKKKSHKIGWGWNGGWGWIGARSNDTWLLRAFLDLCDLLGGTLRQPAFSWAGVDTMPALGSSVASANAAGNHIQRRAGGHRCTGLICTALATFLWPGAGGESRGVEPGGVSIKDISVLDVDLECTLQGGVEVCRLGERYEPSCQYAAKKCALQSCPSVFRGG